MRTNRISFLAPLPRGTYLDRMSNSPIERWSIQALVTLVPGSNERRWRDEYIPKLVAAGALIQDAEAWLGRATEIEAVLLERFPHEPIGIETQRGSELHQLLGWLRILADHSTYPYASIALATGAVSAALHLVTATPLLVLGVGLLAGRIARQFEPR